MINLSLFFALFLFVCIPASLGFAGHLALSRLFDQMHTKPLARIDPEERAGQEEELARIEALNEANQEIDEAVATALRPRKTVTPQL